MRNAIYTAAIAAALGAGAIGTAQAADLETTGTVSNRCSFGTVTPGVMVVNESDFTEIGTEFTGGQRASVPVSYFGTPTVTIETPAGFETSPDLTDAGAVGINHIPVIATAEAPFDGTQVSGAQTLQHQFLTGSSDTIQVGLTASAENNLPVGNYSHITTVTCL